MPRQPKVAILWLGACGGCDEAIVDLNEAVVDLADRVELTLWPVALDFKYDQLEQIKDKGLDMCLISGAVGSSEHRRLAELCRRKSHFVLALGSCACFGGTSGLANLVSREQILDWVYRDAPTVDNPQDVRPQTETRINGRTLTLPEFYGHVYALDQVIDVDYYMPGCPPPPDLLENAINSILGGDLPPRGSTMAPRKSLCDTCERNRRKPERFEIGRIKRIHQVEFDPDFCFLAEGVLCLGPATRGGCGQTCIQANTPCRGCFGPVPGVDDPGARFISALAGLITAQEDDEVDRVIDDLPDLAGYVYRFFLPSSILGRQTAPEDEEE